MIDLHALTEADTDTGRLLRQVRDGTTDLIAESMCLRFRRLINPTTIEASSVVGRPQIYHNYLDGVNTWAQLGDLSDLPLLTKLTGDVLHLLIVREAKDKLRVRWPLCLVETVRADSASAAAQFSAGRLETSITAGKNDPAQYYEICLRRNTKWLDTLTKKLTQ